MLSLLATCHDLRQREVVDYDHPIGNNEAASISETGRILRGTPAVIECEPDTR